MTCQTFPHLSCAQARGVSPSLILYFAGRRHSLLCVLVLCMHKLLDTEMYECRTYKDHKCSRTKAQDTAKPLVEGAAPTQQSVRTDDEPYASHGACVAQGRETDREAKRSGYGPFCAFRVSITSVFPMAKGTRSWSCASLSSPHGTHR